MINSIFELKQIYKFLFNHLHKENTTFYVCGCYHNIKSQENLIKYLGLLNQDKIIAFSLLLIKSDTPDKRSYQPVLN